MENDVIEFEQSIDTFNGTKNIEINSGSEGMSDIQAGIEFIYNMREHTLDIGIATVSVSYTHLTLPTTPYV